MNTASARGTSILVSEIAEQFARITGRVPVAPSDDDPRRFHDIRAPVLNIEQTPTYLGWTVRGAPRSKARDIRIFSMGRTNPKPHLRGEVWCAARTIDTRL